MQSIPRIYLEDIQPLTEFQRNAKMHLARVNDTGRPEVLTVNGKAEAVLVGAAVYERMVAAMEEIETLRSIQRGLDDMDAGNLTTADEFHARFTSFSSPAISRGRPSSLTAISDDCRAAAGLR